jgi:hypothetical protein
MVMSRAADTARPMMVGMNDLVGGGADRSSPRIAGP